MQAVHRHACRENNWMHKINSKLLNKIKKDTVSEAFPPLFNFFFKFYIMIIYERGTKILKLIL